MTDNFLEDEIFGKPEDYQDAVRILSALSGKVHLVITGVCLLSKERESVFSGISKVHFASLSREEIDFYIKNFQPFAFAIFSANTNAETVQIFHNRPLNTCRQLHLLFDHAVII